MSKPQQYPRLLTPAEAREITNPTPPSEAQARVAEVAARRALDDAEAATKRARAELDEAERAEEAAAANDEVSRADVQKHEHAVQAAIAAEADAVRSGGGVKKASAGVSAARETLMTAKRVADVYAEVLAEARAARTTADQAFAKAMAANETHRLTWLRARQFVVAHQLRGEIARLLAPLHELQRQEQKALAAVRAANPSYVEPRRPSVWAVLDTDEPAVQPFVPPASNETTIKVRVLANAYGGARAGDVIEVAQSEYERNRGRVSDFTGKLVGASLRSLDDEQREATVQAQQQRDDAAERNRKHLERREQLRRQPQDGPKGAA